MEKELIINASQTEVEIALMENQKLVELHKQKTSSTFSVGDIFLASIKKQMPSLNAAFVDIGHRKDAFLHYTDLGPQLKSLVKFTEDTMSGAQNTHDLINFELQPDIDKGGKIDQVLDKKQHLLVQILKEPISTKGPRLTCEITIPGRFLVLTPFSDAIAISKKISNADERNRLHLLIESIKPKNFGVILRTAAEGKKVADLHEELRMLEDKWKKIHGELQKTKTPDKLLSELDKTSSILRDVLSDSFNKVVVNDSSMYLGIKDYLKSIAPDKVKIVSHHKGSKSIFEAYGVSRQIKSSFGKTSTMSSGAYLVLEHTEAMHVIDVNSGPKMQRRGQEEASLSVNLESAKEIARQLRLRDLGGIILIDFIDMRKSDNKTELFRQMKEFMKGDRAQHTILPLSRFGLMQITRQRVKPEIKIDTAEVCPSCKGTGKVNATVLLIEDIERDLKFILESHPDSKKLKLHVHPFVYAYLRQGLPSQQMKWYMAHSKWIRLHREEDYNMTEFKFFDQHNDEIRFN